MVEAAARNNRNNNDGLYSIDLRVFLAIMTVVMAASFLAGAITAPIDVALTDMLSGDSPTMVRDNFLLNVSQEESKKIEDEHRPSGQHLLVDIKGVEGDFLNSEERLSKALVNTVKEAG